ncbi:RNA-directed DNA polymerase, eukaryota, reverse transcriptase zinc-binding domain protein [Tanacetum coccineum]
MWLLKKDTLWVKWINVEKLKGKDLWDVKIENNSSPMWRTILGIRNRIREHIWVEIGNGNSTSIWYDNWHPLGPLSNVVTKRDIYDAMADKCTVKEAINRGNWNWPSDWAGKFPILNNYGVPNLKESKDDVTKWKDNNGKLVNFSVKHAWKDRTEEGLKVNWKNMVWYAKCIPTHAFVLWMAVQGRLLTQDEMIKWNPNLVLKCPLCDECCDSHNHLFFKCKYSELVWKKMQTKLCRKFSMN